MWPLGDALDRKKWGGCAGGASGGRYRGGAGSRAALGADVAPMHCRVHAVMHISGWVARRPYFRRSLVDPCTGRGLGGGGGGGGGGDRTLKKKNRIFQDQRPRRVEK